MRVYWQKSLVQSDQSGIRSVDARARIIRGDPFRYSYPSGLYSRNNSVKQTGWEPPPSGAVNGPPRRSRAPGQPVPNGTAAKRVNIPVV